MKRSNNADKSNVGRFTCLQCKRRRNRLSNEQRRTHATPSLRVIENGLLLHRRDVGRALHWCEPLVKSDEMRKLVNRV